MEEAGRGRCPQHTSRALLASAPTQRPSVPCGLPAGPQVRHSSPSAPFPRQAPPLQGRHWVGNSTVSTVTN